MSTEKLNNFVEHIERGVGLENIRETPDQTDESLINRMKDKEIQIFNKILEDNVHNKELTNNVDTGQHHIVENSNSEVQCLDLELFGESNADSKKLEGAKIAESCSTEKLEGAKIAESCSTEKLNEKNDALNHSHRRNSLPEGHHKMKMENKNVLPFSKTDDFVGIKKNIPSTSDLQSERIKVAPDVKQFTDVVKNVHGLFSMVGGSLKNAYKPNFEGIVNATQKMKNGYLQKQEKFLNDNRQFAVESINKYSTLNLSNDNATMENYVFDKCKAGQVETHSQNISFKKINHSPKKSATSEVSKKRQSDLQKDDYFVISNDDSVLQNSLNTAYDDKKSMSEELQNFKGKNEIDFGVSISTGISQSGVDRDFVKDVQGSLHMKKSVPIEVSGSSEGLKEVEEEFEEKECCKEARISVDALKLLMGELNRQLEAFKIALADKDSMKKELENKCNMLSSQLESALKERDSSVMRYAVSERSALEARQAVAGAQAAEKAAKNEASLLAQRLKAQHADRARICDMLDEKCHEVTAGQKEISHLKDELQSCDVKLKWAQAKLVTEMEAHKESATLAEKMTHRLSLHEGTSVPSPETDAIIKEKEASVILERYERRRVEEQLARLRAELDKINAEVVETRELARELKTQAESSAAEATALRGACGELRSQAAVDCERLAQAQARAARLDALTIHLQQEQEKSARLSRELEAERTLRSDTATELSLRARREAELLRQAERLTQAGVRQQAACSEAQAKALALSVDNASLRAAASAAAETLAAERSKTLTEHEERLSDARALAAAAARATRRAEQAEGRLEATSGEMAASAAKHASQLKELKREVMQLRRKCERLEAEGSSSQKPVTSTATHQRTGSCSSLSSFEGHSKSNAAPDTPETHSEEVQQMISQEPDRQKLVERVVALQRSSARSAERADFLEEHARQLTAELQRKAKVLRALLAAAPKGAIAAAASDASKIEMAKRGGIMASVYGSQVADDGMTLELSLEINGKLQAVLEDTLLKNITLKENMDTLGDDITRLKEELKKRPANK